MAILVLSLLAAVLIAAVLYQQFAFRTGIRREIRKMHRNLQAISDGDGGGRVTVFTEEKELQELAAQINRLLEEKAESEADFRRLEIASRKMLSNISHDLKTPLTVIRGYLEMIRIRSEVALRAQSGAEA